MGQGSGEEGATGKGADEGVEDGRGRGGVAEEGERVRNCSEVRGAGGGHELGGEAGREGEPETEDAAVDLLELESGFGGVNDGDEVVFSSGRRRRGRWRREFWH